MQTTIDGPYQPSLEAITPGSRGRPEGTRLWDLVHSSCTGFEAHSAPYAWSRLADCESVTPGSAAQDVWVTVVGAQTSVTERMLQPSYFRIFRVHEGLRKVHVAGQGTIIHQVRK